MLTCTFEDGYKTSLRHVTVDTVVIKDQRILLVRRAEGLLEGGKWALPGGYVDRDETTQQAAAREVLEETGYQVVDMQLLTIRDNPDRPHEDRQNISFIYLAQARQKIAESDAEVSEVAWFELTALPDPTKIAFDHGLNTKLYQEWLNDMQPLPMLR